MTDIELMQSLIDRLNKASDAYYNGQNEVMSNYEWDSLFDELKSLEEKTGIILEDSPTNTVSTDSIEGKKEEHEFSALSLAKTKKVEDLVKWANGLPIWLSWKLDGLTLVVDYKDGKLDKVVTRGDGHIGTNITHLAKGIHNILPTIKDKGHVVIRGEALISYSDFEKFKMESDEDYANPRNLASGSLALKDINELEKRNLNWVPFTLVYTDKEFNSWGDQMDYLEDNGFKVVNRECINSPTYENIKEVIDKWTKKVETFDYPVDGLVIAYDDLNYAKGGSVTGHHATRAGYAFKWQDESAKTTLDHVEWSCAASTITPVAVFEPVELEGTTVKRANLCNISECERLGIGDKGTEIEVIKANKIIPKVIHVSKTIGDFIIPNVCPVCGSDTRIEESESGAKTLHCLNKECPAKELKKFTRFVSKAGMEIDGISEATLARFINEGWIKEYADIYKLVNHKEEIEKMDGFGQKSALNIVTSINKAKERNAHKFLYALNIPLIGIDVVKKLLDTYNFKELIELARTKDDEFFSSIDGIGPEKSTTFVRYFHNDKNNEIFDNLLKEINVVDTVKVVGNKRCENLTFVVTGDVFKFKNRNELKAYIEQEGGKVTGFVSKSTDYLINNDIESLSSKNKRAGELNIPIISEDEFIKKFGH